MRAADSSSAPARGVLGASAGGVEPWLHGGRRVDSCVGHLQPQVPGVGEAGAGGVASPRARTQAVACLMVVFVVSQAKERYQKWPFRLAVRRYL